MSFDLDPVGNWNRQPNLGTFWCGAPPELDGRTNRVALVDGFKAAGIEFAQVAFNDTGSPKRISCPVTGGGLAVATRA